MLTAGRPAAGVGRRARALGCAGPGSSRRRVRPPGRRRGAGAAGRRVLRRRGPAGRWSLAVALAALRGWVAGHADRGRVSDLQRLVPQYLAAVRDLDTLQRDTGVAGEVDVLVEGRDLTDPKVIAWMRAYQSRSCCANGYSAEDGLRQGGAVPGALAARPVPHPRALGHRATRSARCWTPSRRTSRRR